jgi:ABC-type multidrug transport system ATPase subunit
MWNFLDETIQSTGTTIIITTHYIEEAIKANVVGIMRQGEILAVDAPRNILQNLQADTLEDAFLVLCNKESNYYETIFPKIEGEHSNFQLRVLSSKNNKNVSAFRRIQMINFRNFKKLIGHYS